MNAFLPVEEEIRAYISQDDKDPVRAIKVVIDSKRPRLILKVTVPLGDSLETDFGKLADMFQDDEPCAVLVKTHDKKGTATGDDQDESQWVIIVWVPEAAPIRQKTMFANVSKSVKETFGTHKFKDMDVRQKSEA